MVESTIGIMEKLKDVLLVDKIINKLLGLKALIPDSVKALYNEYKILCFMIAIAGLVLVAFEGYKLFKMALYVLSSVGFAAGGYLFLAPFVEKYTKDLIPEIVNTKVLVALVCALVAVFLTRCAYTLMIIIIGLGCGFLFGYSYVWRVLINYFTTLDFLKENYVRFAIGGVFAAIAGLLFILLFKHVFMVGSGLGCSVVAAILLRRILVPGGDDNVKICFIIFGVVLAIFAIVHQYKEEEKALEIVF